MSEENLTKPKPKRRGLVWLAVAAVALLLGAAGVTVALDDEDAKEPAATSGPAEPTSTDEPTAEAVEPTATADASPSPSPSPSTPTPTVDPAPTGEPPSAVAGGL